jgi:hypothetical protein
VFGFSMIAIFRDRGISPASGLLSDILDGDGVTSPSPGTARACATGPGVRGCGWPDCACG